MPMSRCQLRIMGVCEMGSKGDGDRDEIGVG